MNTYSALVGLSVWIGLAYAYWRTHDWGVLTDALIVGVCALVVGRMGYVALHYSYFVDHAHEIVEIVSLASPGYQEHAALLGAGLGWAIRRRGVLPAALCVLPSLMGIAASLGCIPNGCAYGREVFWQESGEHALAWRLAIDWPDAYGINAPRLPTQLFMAGWLVIVGLVIIWLGRGDKETRRQGDKVKLLVSLSPYLSWLLLFALGDFVIQFMRADASPLWAGLRAEQWADGVLGLWAAAGIVQMRLRIRIFVL